MQNGAALVSTPKASIAHDQPVRLKFIIYTISFLYCFWIQMAIIICFDFFLLKVLCSAWKDDGTTVFSGGCDKQAKMWPLSGNQPVTVAMHDEPIKEIAWIPEMNLLVTGSWDKTLK